MESGFKTMWIIVMFDLPTDNKQARKNYSRFRKQLLDDGFTMMQFSVYSRCLGTREIADGHIKLVEKCLPPDGEVRILLFTDKQFENMKVFLGKKHKKITESPQWEQLKFF